MDMSGIRKYFDHQDGWGADWVKCVVELSTKVLEIFTASQFHFYLPCLNVCLAQCLQRFFIVNCEIALSQNRRPSPCETSRMLLTALLCRLDRNRHISISTLSLIIQHSPNFHFRPDKVNLILSNLYIGLHFQPLSFLSLKLSLDVSRFEKYH